MTEPHLDIVVFGATSFVGRILCGYLADRYGSGGDLTWAAAGRSRARLEALRDSLGDGARNLELIVADAADEDALRHMCARTRVVISTVGPYALYGEPLIRACAEGRTVASATNVLEELSGNPELRRQVGSPYCLCPDDHAFGARQHRIRSAEYDADFKRWAAPFLMEPINVRVVHRSNSLSGNAYGTDFRYDEALLVRSRMAALRLAGGLTAFGLAMMFPPTRRALGKLVPKPGTGPSPEQQAAGFFDIRFVGEIASGQKLFAKVTGDRDPGYGSTAKMLGEAGACLALDLKNSDRPGGVWTPSTLFGGRLLDRLAAHAGLTFELLERV